MLQLQDVTKAFGEKTLLEHVTWQVGDRDRVGLCGPNGAGKTTLLKMLAGLDEPDTGIIQKPNALTLGYLPQDGLAHSGRSVVAEASLALKPLLDLKAEMHDLEARLGDSTASEAEHDAMLARYSEVQDRFRLSDGYQIELKVATVLRGLGFEPEAQQQLTDHLSGGWQMRLALAKLLLCRAGPAAARRADQPSRSRRAQLARGISRRLSAFGDPRLARSLLSRCGRHAHRRPDAAQDHRVPHQLHQYLEQRDAALERLREAKRRQDEEIQRVEEFINRFRYQATKAAQVQSRIKMLEKVERLEVPPERKRIHFQFPAAPKSGRMVLELKNARKAYRSCRASLAKKRSCSIDVNLHIERGDRIALVGHNGAGKSTLMRMLSGEERPDLGSRTEGHQVVMQYFAQDEATRLDPALTVHDTLSSGSPHHMVPAIRNILGGFLFSGDDVYKKAGVLSGGERTRLAVARMLLRPSNTLLLDEPTNHLDIDSKEVLLDALADYGGTLIFVSHDRYFVEKLATKIVEVGDGRASLYPATTSRSCGARVRRLGPMVPLVPSLPMLPKVRFRSPVPMTSGERRKPEQSYEERKRESGREEETRARLQGAEGSRRRARGAHCRPRESHQGRRAGDGGAGLLCRPRKIEAGPRPTSGPDVGGRRASRPMGNAAERSRGVFRLTKFVT